MTLDLISLPDLRATEQAAKRLAPYLRCGDTLALQGSLGAGKTTFARALLHALGVGGDVPSPTFTLLQVYETSHFPVYHFDLYRLEGETELAEIGWDDALADGLAIVEWPERAATRLPKDRLILYFTIDDKNARALAFEPHGEWVLRWKNLKQGEGGI